MKRRRKSLITKADSAEKKLSRMSSEHKQLTIQTELLAKLNADIKLIEGEIVVEETSMADFKRTTARALLAHKFGGMIELCEKGIVGCSFPSAFHRHLTMSSRSSETSGNSLLLSVLAVYSFWSRRIEDCFRRYLTMSPSRVGSVATTKAIRGSNHLPRKLCVAWRQSNLPTRCHPRHPPEPRFHPDLSNLPTTVSVNPLQHPLQFLGHRLGSPSRIPAMANPMRHLLQTLGHPPANPRAMVNPLQHLLQTFGHPLTNLS